jgi:predicted cytidylate kinase
MIITVGGSIGSGKSTLARLLAQKLNLDYCSVGQIMRDMAKERGMSLLKFSMAAEKDPSIDKELDSRQKELAAKGGCIMDSRLGAYMLKSDFKIWLDASLRVQAKRIVGRDGGSASEAEILIARREASETERYKRIYNIDITDQSVYDLVVDTDELTPEMVLQKCVDAIRKKGLL